MRQNLIQHITILARWVLLALGLGELVLILFGQAWYWVSTACVAILFALFLYRFQKKNSPSELSGSILVASVILLATTLLYNELVLLSTPTELIIVNIIATVTFGVCGFAVVLFKKSNVTK